jgi:hypothetical protein
LFEVDFLQGNFEILQLFFENLFFQLSQKLQNLAKKTQGILGVKALPLLLFSTSILGEEKYSFYISVCVVQTALQYSFIPAYIYAVHSF